MKIIDRGHQYALTIFDQNWKMPRRWVLRFVKREGFKYPGNVGTYPGTNLQEVYRACINRHQYLNRQVQHWINGAIVLLLRLAIYLLEWRAARRHHRRLRWAGWRVEKQPFCSTCGHLQCDQHGETL